MIAMTNEDRAEIETIMQQPRVLYRCRTYGSEGTVGLSSGYETGTCPVCGHELWNGCYMQPLPYPTDEIEKE